MIVLVWCILMLAVLTVAAWIADSWPSQETRDVRRATAGRKALGRSTRR